MACEDRRVRINKFTRRNLLSIAWRTDHPRAGATRAAKFRMALILGNRDLADMHLNEIALERLDFTGWDLRRLRSSLGAITYCVGFKQADYDESLQKLETLEGCDLGDDNDDRDDDAALENGAARLRRLTRHWVSSAGTRRRIHQKFGYLPRRITTGACSWLRLGTSRRKLTSVVASTGRAQTKAVTCLWIPGNFFLSALLSLGLDWTLISSINGRTLEIS